MRQRRKKREPGRPKSPDPRTHLPSVVIRLSLLDEIKMIAAKSDHSLSYHFDKAVENYLKQVSERNKNKVTL